MVSPLTENYSSFEYFEGVLLYTAMSKGHYTGTNKYTLVYYSHKQYQHNCKLNFKISYVKLQS